MKYEAIIEFNKYTLAVAAGGIVYAIEKGSPMPTLAGRVFLLCVLTALLVAAFLGVIVFAVATKAMHAQPGEAVPKLSKAIAFWGTTHIVALLLGLTGILGIIVDRLFDAPQVQPACTCVAAPSAVPASNRQPPR